MLVQIVLKLSGLLGGDSEIDLLCLFIIIFSYIFDESISDLPHMTFIRHL